MNKKEATYILDKLYELYPDAGPELNFKNRFELIIAVILSAQCTDKRVNIVTETLFSKYPTPKDLANADINELMNDIKSIGSYTKKSMYIKNTAKIIYEKYNSEVPNNREILESFPGVGHKTASVVLSCGFGIPAIAVDTHVFRVSNRIGLSNSKNVTACEKDLMKVIPKDKWSLAHHLLIFHGRRCCKAPNPKCQDCYIKDLCSWYKNMM